MDRWMVDGGVPPHSPLLKQATHTRRWPPHLLPTNQVNASRNPLRCSSPEKNLAYLSNLDRLPHFRQTRGERMSAQSAQTSQLPEPSATAPSVVPDESLSSPASPNVDASGAETHIRRLASGSHTSSTSGSSNSSNEVAVVDSAHPPDEGEEKQEQEEEDEEKRLKTNKQEQIQHQRQEHKHEQDHEQQTPASSKNEVRLPTVSNILLPSQAASAEQGRASALAQTSEKLTKKTPGCLDATTSFISRFNRLMSTSTGTDRVLMTLSYSLTALTSQLDRISQYRAQVHSANSQGVQVIPFGLFGYFVFGRRRETSRLFAISAQMKALASLISDVRIFMRLWGLASIYEWLVATVRAPPKDETLRKIAYLQISANIFYQILENLAYLGQHKVLSVRKRRQANYWLWSSRFWMAHVVLEFWRLKRENDLSVKGKERAEVVEEDPKWYNFAHVMNSDGKKSAWYRQLWSNMAYAPLTVHWSLDSGTLLSQLNVGTLGTIAGIIGLQQAWRRAA